ncbi:lactosylceramide 4-alpha-galactosyltransferase [Klebsormidium nitens]|uniref:Lactosylceramide 4-alpha-galactosyltransferase n=1 Tax=Klebsormidium nitens TaxID=105231 RepID=A0A1Y1HXW6_KLENI|nr:lactosylceramide 4-alpha-galactosyltransferase [Klebsormidium nitens]|eukprot:GAQ80698.1 lactosylceramide 4-alpha-galactosyltransferase [Klebsormidium nitens]
MNPPPLSAMHLVLWLVILSTCCYTWLSSEPFLRFGNKLAGSGAPPVNITDRIAKSSRIAEGAKSSSAESFRNGVRGERGSPWELGAAAEVSGEARFPEFSRSGTRKEREIMASNALAEEFDAMEGSVREGREGVSKPEVSLGNLGEESILANGSSQLKNPLDMPDVEVKAVGDSLPGKNWPAEEPGCFHHPATGVERSIGDYIQETGCPVTFFMLWTTTSAPNKTLKSSGFQMRHLRSVESAFVTHPRACVIFLSVLKFENRFMSELQARGFRLLILDEFDVTSLVKYTPVEVWYKKVDERRKGKHFFSHFTDLMRLAIVYKFGGVYMDTDCIVMNDVTDVRNSFGAQMTDRRTGTPKQVNGAVLIFDRGSSFLYECMVEASGNYNQEKWEYNGPGLLRRMLSRKDLEGSYTVLPTMAMYPIYYKNIWAYSGVNGTAKSADEQATFWARMRNETRVFHWYNQIARKHRAAEGSLMRAAFNEFCIFCEEVVE